MGCYWASRTVWPVTDGLDQRLHGPIPIAPSTNSDWSDAIITPQNVLLYAALTQPRPTLTESDRFYLAVYYTLRDENIKHSDRRSNLPIRDSTYYDKTYKRFALIHTKEFMHIMTISWSSEHQN